MRIDRKLNLVIPITRDDGTELFVHSAPLSSDVFNQYWEIAGKTMNALYTGGFGYFAPRFACNMLRKIAEDGVAQGKQPQEWARVERGFVSEIRQRTNVLALSDKGWELRAFDEAKTSGLIDESEADEIDNATVFFTLASRSHLKSQMEEVRGALSLWNARTELSSCTEFMKSLPTSTADASTGETATPS